MRRTRRWLVLVAAGAALTLVAAACTDDDGEPADTGAGATEEPVEEDTQMGMTITDIVAENEEFGTLLAAVQAADLAETLSGEGPFTVFAPTDEAFAALPEGTLDSLLEPENQDRLASVLTYHVVPAEVMAADVTAGDVETVNGAAITIDVEDGVTITDAQGNEATVTRTDIDASNGVIHVIDAVLLP